VRLAQEDAQATEGIRVGQAFYNRLAVLRPDLAAFIRGTSLDPFYTGLSTELLDVLAVRWDTDLTFAQTDADDEGYYEGNDEDF